MAKILIDLRMASGTLHGIARYALELARRAPRAVRGHQFSVLVGPEGPGDLGDLEPGLPVVRCAAPFLSPWEQPALLTALARSGCDLFHATSFSVPALWPGRLVITLHDANHLALAHEYGAAQALYYRLVVRPRARWAQALITVSEFSRQELAKHLRLDPHRLQVISPGVSEAFVPPTEAAIQAFTRERSLPRRYFVALGSAKPFKNLALLQRLAPRLPAPLALVAPAGTARRLGFSANTIELADVPEASMPTLYGGAIALLVPSRYEGFGLPVLESMGAGRPVIAAKAGALPEAVGEAGVLVDPDDLEGWLEVAQRLFRDEAEGRRLSELGLARAQRRTWDECARQTVAVYERALTR